ncbi:MAG: PEP-CTERM sorting domain-containing protein [Nitrospirae bacterium]|nr:PEP-CTERM sorting domain-containing protein [Nitrospirota bacterium]
MRTLRNVGLAILIGLLYVSSSAYATPLSLNYSSEGNAEVQFTGTGDTFTFVDDTVSGKDFQLGSVTNGTGDLDTVGLLGNISGTFTIGAISTPLPGYETASVSGAGTLSIVDESSVVFTGDLVWVNIYTLGTGGTINAGGTVNLTNISYSGSNTDLLAFMTGSQSGIASATFQFVPAQSLTALTTDGSTNSTTHSGSIAVPEPMSLLLLGSGLLVLGALGRKRMIKGNTV